MGLFVFAGALFAYKIVMPSIHMSYTNQTFFHYFGRVVALSAAIILVYKGLVLLPLAMVVNVFVNIALIHMSRAYEKSV